ncbi:MULTISPECIES: hypothetical protein [unclassified Streptomyces]|uniref:hypothetical protein n=1 Tax=unclassified Streptomyces TaxID=2593676 RepID=UPI0036E5A0E4
MSRVLHLTRDGCSGRFENMGSLRSDQADGYQNYADTDAIPLVFTTLPRLQQAPPAW